MGTVDRVIRIVQVTPNIDQTLYIIMESTEIFTSQSIRKLSSNDAFRISDISTNEKVVSLGDAVQHSKASSSKPHFVISSTLSLPHLKLHIQFSRNTIVCLVQHSLVNLLKQGFPVSFELLTSLPRTVPQTVNDPIQYLSTRLGDLEDYICSVINGYDRSRRAFRTMMKSIHDERHKDRKVIKNIRERLGHLHEEIIRQAVTTAYGIEYGLSLEIKGLSDIMVFVGTGLGITTEQRNVAREHLISKLTDTGEPPTKARLWKL